MLTGGHRDFICVLGSGRRRNLEAVWGLPRGARWRSQLKQAGLRVSSSAPAVVARRERRIRGRRMPLGLPYFSSLIWATGCAGRNPSCGEAAMWGPAPLFQRGQVGVLLRANGCFAIPLHGWLRVPAEHGWSCFKVKDPVLPP